MKKALVILKTAVIITAFMLVGIPVSLYIILSTRWAQDDICRAASDELSKLLQTEVSIGSVDLHPFNRLSLHDVAVMDGNGTAAFEAGEISAAIELFHLLRTGKIVVDYILVDCPNARLYKASDDSPLNIEPIIAALKSDKQPKNETKLDLAANTIIISNGRVSYDVMDAPRRDSIFDAKHIEVADIFLHAYVPSLSADNYSAVIERLSFNEKSGFAVTGAEVAAEITPNGSKLNRLSVMLPHSEIHIAPINIAGCGTEAITDALEAVGIEVNTDRQSRLYLPDLAAFAPPLSRMHDTIAIDADATVSTHCIKIDRLALNDSANKVSIRLSGIADSIQKGMAAQVAINELKVSLPLSAAGRIMAEMQNKPSDNVPAILSRATMVQADIKANGTPAAANIAAVINAGANKMSAHASYQTADTFKTVNYKSSATASLAQLSQLSGQDGEMAALSAIHASLNSDGRIAGRNTHVHLSVDTAAVTYRGNEYSAISLDAEGSPSDVRASLTMGCELLDMQADCAMTVADNVKEIETAVTVSHADLSAAGIGGQSAIQSLSATVNAHVGFSSIDDISGFCDISDLTMTSGGEDVRKLEINKIAIETFPNDEWPGLSVKSDFMDAYLNGHYRVSSIYAELCAITDSIVPAAKLVAGTAPKGENNFTFNADIRECEQLCSFFKLPVSVINPIHAEGHLSSPFGSASLTINAPYLLNKDKIIENTSFTAEMDASREQASLILSTKMPTKKGPMTVKASMNAHSDRTDNRIDWNIERKIPINGAFDFSTIFSRDIHDRLVTDILFHPGTITFGNDVWAINPSSLRMANQNISIDNFALKSGTKTISIDGTVSTDAEDVLSLSLNEINLIDIFETLEIDKALIGGQATGEFTARALLSPAPEIYCDSLHVDGISYNGCVIGDADIASFWDNERQSVFLDADISESDGLKSRIFGDIFPTKEALDLNFDANRVPVGFLKPFMSAFASDISGHASGKARLFGTFKYIDMEGDLFADNLSLKIAFTNTCYTASDSIKLRPGLIDINNVTVFDRNGHAAKLNGYVKHKFFKEPSFDIRLTDAKNFLSYDTNPNISPDWYGTIYGNGSASISGAPGVVDIGVRMATADQSNFTFVLSDRLDADEYSFITFHDSRAQARRDSIDAAGHVPDAVRQIRERIASGNNDSPSAYNMDFQMDITPAATITLVMDPVGGDEIKATGNGNLRLTYGSLNNDLKMYGTYTLNRGNYNFTLQDIIIKDFTIKPGSTIAFHGDPYSAMLDIQAAYGVNANLSDLDESFLLDKDLNRTNVPVNALLKVSGDMRQPDIDFDLEFPTLTQDTYRKVKSIVSTRDMMNRQIIYLLALNRFYTPDYMASTTRGNELSSVASSTISSQLSSMLGKLSDDWSIAPNLRSDRGDFSDVEVDVALSSRLLNNRLLFNGNFGYRDKTLNTNQFIGDFDIEYLLNPKGSWRLKAYNRYNDQNYYVRTAQTTQGLGFVFKKDFDKFFNFLHRKNKTAESDNTQPLNENTDNPHDLPAEGEESKH